MPSSSHNKNNKKSLESRMRSVSLDNKDGGCSGGGGGGGGGGAAGATSSMQDAFQPMFKGQRIQLWQEGWEQRCMRVKNGYNHHAMEWIVPTDRSVGRRTKAPERGLRKKYHTPREATDSSLHELLEPLTLPPTKLEEKRTKIFRLIERKEKKRLANQYEETKKKVAALGHVDGQGKLIGGPELSDYEKNKLRQGKSNINFQLPTGASTVRGNPSATQRGTNDK